MVISNRLSNKISSDLAMKGIIDTKYEDCYSYCLEFFFDMMLFSISLILIGFLLHRLVYSIIFILVMMPIKMTAGGAHAGSRLLCDILSYSVYMIVLYLPSFLYVNPSVSLILSIIASVVIIYLSPIEVSERQAVINNQKQLKTICAVFCMLSVLSEFVFMYFGYMDYAEILFFCLIVILINQLIGLLMISHT